MIGKKVEELKKAVILPLSARCQSLQDFFNSTKRGTSADPEERNSAGLTKSGLAGRSGGSAAGTLFGAGASTVSGRLTSGNWIGTSEVSKLLQIEEEGATPRKKREVNDLFEEIRKKV